MSVRTHTTTRITRRRALTDARPESCAHSSAVRPITLGTRPRTNGRGPFAPSLNPFPLSQTQWRNGPRRTHGFILRPRQRPNGPWRQDASVVLPNRDTQRLEIAATRSKQTSSLISNRDKMHSSCDPRLAANAPAGRPAQGPARQTNERRQSARLIPPNRDKQRLEIAANDSKQTRSPISNRDKMHSSGDPRLTIESPIGHFAERRRNRKISEGRCGAARSATAFGRKVAARAATGPGGSIP